jgi:hypothetical protein
MPALPICIGIHKEELYFVTSPVFFCVLKIEVFSVAIVIFE